MKDFKAFSASLPDMFADMAKGLPDKVHCVTCGNARNVIPGVCLRRGWPVCCGQTMRLGGLPERKTKECPGGCTHTDREHQAFDEGLAAGEAGVLEDACPYEDFGLREDWKTGHSIGFLNQQKLENF